MTMHFATVPPSIAYLQTLATAIGDHRVMPFGVDTLDSRLSGGGYGLVGCTR